jgi:hypothetical protein
MHHKDNGEAPSESGLAVVPSCIASATFHRDGQVLAIPAAAL